MDLEQQLRAALAPRRPGAHLRAAVMAHVSALPVTRRRTGRGLLVDAVLVIAVAAAMLVVQRMNPSPLTAATPALPASQADAMTIPPEASVPNDPEQKMHDETVASSAAAASFTVRVLPLQSEDADAGRRERVAVMYTAFVDKLRTVPGLILLGPAPAGNTAEAAPNYRITIRNEGQASVGRFLVRLQIETLKRDGGWLGGFMTSYAGAAVCGNTAGTNAGPSDLTYCSTPVDAAANLVDMIRRMVFPPDASLRREVQARLLDRSLDEQQRLRALTLLSSFGRAHVEEGGPGAPIPYALRDPAIIRAAVDLATNAADAEVRAQAWSALRGTADVELIAPLVTALDRDSDSEVRLAVLGTLVGEFAEDPRVHAALQITAQRDTRTMIRALAQRSLDGLGGETGWRSYVLNTIKDTNRPALERIEPLFYAMGLPTVTAGASTAVPTPQSALSMLDPEAIQALTEALPKAATGSSMLQQSAAMLVDQLGAIEHPAITDMLLASLNDDSHWLDRGSALGALAALPSRRTDPRVRAVLEGSSADGTSATRVANTAVVPFTMTPRSDWIGTPPGTDAAAPADSGPKPPRLGVVIAPVEPAPYVPKELVGKARVARVTPGSVGKSAGLIEGDILLEINGTPISSLTDTPMVLDNVPRGVDVDVVVDRSGEKVRLKARF